MSSSEAHANDQNPANCMNDGVHCLYCGVAAKDWIWLKGHLACIGGAIVPCSRVPNGVKEIMKNGSHCNKIIDLGINIGKDHFPSSSLQKNWRLYMNTINSEVTQLYGSESKKYPKRDMFGKSGMESNSSIGKRAPKPIKIMDNSLVREAKKSIGRFLYENMIDLGVVKSPSFEKMISLGSRLWRNQVPTIQELEGSILKDSVKEMLGYVNEFRDSWSKKGCSIILDGWTNENGQSLINILVDSPQGTVYLRSYDISNYIGNVDSMILFLEQVIVEVGIKNVVQIITYSTSIFMKELGTLLAEKYRPIFWTVGASCCVELMLEKMKRVNLIKETLDKATIITSFLYSHPDVLNVVRDHNNGCDLFKPSKIKSIVPFLTLENIVVGKESLKKIFLSPDSRGLILTSTVEGREVINLVKDCSFWSEAAIVLKVTVPLVRLIEWISNSKFHMGYIYKKIDEVKKSIKEEFENKESQYTSFWKVIDYVWNEHLYSPLHSAGYFLNPELFYSRDMYIDPEVFTALLCCIVRASEDCNVQDSMTLQLELYQKAKGAFSVGSIMEQRSDISPATWWSRFGGKCQELQTFAIRILSQTCDGASRFQLKRSLVETLFTKERNSVEQERLSDMIFLHYNMHLQKIVSR